MRDNVIRISFHTDLPTRLQNLLRFRMEHAQWERQRMMLEDRLELARVVNDMRLVGDICERIDRHILNYELIGLP